MATPENNSNPMGTYFTDDNGWGVRYENGTVTYTNTFVPPTLVPPTTISFLNQDSDESEDDESY